ncbi:MAG: hypothetical protein ACPLUI_13800 [Desulfofundulus sp.]
MQDEVLIVLGFEDFGDLEGFEDFEDFEDFEGFGVPVKVCLHLEGQLTATTPFWCYRCYTLDFQGFRALEKVLQRCYNGVTWCYKVLHL